jgi:hypothetical protein
MPKKPATDQDIDWDAAVTGAAIRAVTQSNMVSRCKRKDPKPARDRHYRENIDFLNPSSNKIIDRSLVDGDSLENQDLGYKAQQQHIFTLPELKFLVIYLQGGVTIKSAMDKDSYVKRSGLGIYGQARKMVKSYAAQVEDKPEICRNIGLRWL